MNLSARMRTIYEYKLKSLVQLLSRGELAYLGGVMTEKAAGTNAYLRYLDWRGRSPFVEREIRGHELTIDLADPGLSRHLLIRGVHEPDATNAYLDALTRALDRLDSDRPVVIDVGANLGYFALQTATVLGDRGVVYAFEPEPGNRALLERNVERNGYADRIRVRSQAIGDADGIAQLLLSDRSNWHRIDPVRCEDPDESDGARVGSVDEDRIDVDLRRVDSAIVNEDVPLESVVGLRMDVEGYEAAIFEGMDELLSAKRPLVMFVEIHPETLSDQELSYIVEDLRTNEFSVAFAGRDRTELDIEHLDELEAVGGSHVRLVLERENIP